MPTKRFAIMLTISGLTLGVEACGHNSEDKAGGAVRSDPVVLRLADAAGGEAITLLYADEVARRSQGALRIEVKSPWRYRQPDREARTIGDVKAGKVEIGLGATRSFTDVGVSSFDALHAPLLIDSLALEDKVLRSPIAPQMLKGLEPLGVVGVGIVTGPLRRPLGLTRPFVRPADFRGQAFGVVQSRVARQTISALGGTPREVVAWTAIESYQLDGAEADLATIANQALDHDAAAVTANVALWARPQVLYINREAYARLAPTQRRVLKEAGQAVLTPALAKWRSTEAEATRMLCARGLRFTTGDVSALQRAIRPVYATLDARTNEFVSQIRELAGGVSADPAPDCRGQAPTPRPVTGIKTPLDGTYRLHLTRAEVTKEGNGAKPVDENFGEFRYVLDRGHFSVDAKGRPIGSLDPRRLRRQRRPAHDHHRGVRRRPAHRLRREAR